MELSAQRALTVVTEYNLNVVSVCLVNHTAVPIWILFCQFIMDTMEGEDSLQGVRSTFEKAIIAAGLHVTEVSCWLTTVIFQYLHLTIIARKRT